MEISIAPMLVSGLTLMLTGMGIVFSFLLLLVWIIQRTHKFLLRWEPDDLSAGTAVSPLTRAVSVDDTAVVAAIVAAIHQHEQNTIEG
jgi:oxaloacetate decarboxylase gamma subunit